MNLLIVIENCMAALILIWGIALTLKRFVRSKERSFILLAFAILMLFISAVINVLEYTIIPEAASEFEEFIGILFMPILIFSFHAAIISKVLKERKQSEQKFKAIFNQTFSFLGLLSPDGKLLDANSTAQKFIGYSGVYEPGIDFAKTRWWAHSEVEQNKITNAIARAQRGETVRFETSHTDRQQKLYHIDFTIKPLYGENGELLYLIPEGRDITEIKQVRLELEKHQKFLEEMVFARTKELNNANSRILAINKSLSIQNEALEAANKQLDLQRLELENALIKLKETQVTLIESEKMASVGVLTAGIAHEINNPVNFISSNLNGLQKVIVRIHQLFVKYQQVISQHKNEAWAIELTKIDEEYDGDSNQEALSVLTANIHTGIDRTVEIINSLRYFLHQDSGDKSEVDLHEVIKAVLTILNHEYKNRIKVEQDFQLQEKVVCEVGKINQVIMNILSNAIEAIPNKGNIAISTYEKKQRAVIAITNDGPEIPKNILTKIYDPFFTTKPLGKGTGLGLYLSYNIIKDHQGQLHVKSSPEQTVFEIHLPIKSISDE